MVKAEGALKDALESNTPTNGPVADLKLVLLRPMYAPLSRLEVAERGLEEPSEEEVESWAWGEDVAALSRYFAFSAVFLALSLLSFAAVTYGLESPGAGMTIAFIALGSVGLAVASSILGRGLYRQYVVRGYVSWDYKGYPVAKIERNTNLYKKISWWWYVYTSGGAFLAVSMGLGVVLGNNLLSGIVTDYEGVRLMMLASMGLGILLSVPGAWPIARRVVETAEAQRRLGKAKYLAPPRLLLTALPLLVSGLSILINWFFL